MTTFIWRNCLLFFALLVQALGHPPASLGSRATPVAAPQVQIPRETHIQRAISTSQSTFSNSGSVGSAPSATSAGNASDTALPACSTFNAMINSCKSLSPGFVSLPATEQVLCLCETVQMNTTPWLPNFFDDAVTSCEQELLSISDYSDYQIVKGWAGLCTEVGNTLASSTNSGGAATTLTGIILTPQPTTVALTTSTAISGNSPNSTSIPPSGISTFSTKEKVGIALGGSVSLSLAGYCLYLVFRFKKPHAVHEETEGREDVNSPQNDTMPAGTEKVSPKSSEVHEAVVNIFRRVTV